MAIWFWTSAFTGTSQGLSFESSSTVLVNLVDIVLRFFECFGNREPERVRCYSAEVGSAAGSPVVSPPVVSPAVNMASFMSLVSIAFFVWPIRRMAVRSLFMAAIIDFSTASFLPDMVVDVMQFAPPVEVMDISIAPIRKRVQLYFF